MSRYVFDKDKLLKKSYLKLTSVVVKIFNNSNLKNVKIPMQHRSPNEVYDDVAWFDKEFNYRLDYPVEEIYYAYTLVNGFPTVVGHLGLSSDLQIKAVYVDPSHRNKGIAEKLYLNVFKANPTVLSDDFDAMEPEAKKI
jgi:ribosomal protein S18 acetylase RimI-like enzyme